MSGINPAAIKWIDVGITCTDFILNNQSVQKAYAGLLVL